MYCVRFCSAFFRAPVFMWMIMAITPMNAAVIMAHPAIMRIMFPEEIMIRIRPSPPMSGTTARIIIPADCPASSIVGAGASVSTSRGVSSRVTRAGRCTI